MTDLAVVVVSWNVHDLLRGCLRSLQADLERAALDVSVWVVDNASTDGSPEMVAAEFPQANLIASRQNPGFAVANNRALREIARSQPVSPAYLWFLNPDTELRPGATQALVECLEKKPRAGVVGPRLLYGDGSFQHGAFRFPGLAQLAYELFPPTSRFYDTAINGRYPRRRYERGVPFPVDHPLGASMMVRKAAIDQVGVMDEGYRMYCEEIDWCWRMRRAGWRAFCVPEAEVVHHAGQSSAQAPVSSFKRLWLSRARLYSRHHGPLTWPLAQAMVRLGMAQRAHRAARAGDGDLAAACQEVVEAWEEARWVSSPSS